jgi:excisionase family DNA binding protein
MRLDLDTDAIAQADIPAALAQIAAAQSSLASRLLSNSTQPETKAGPSPEKLLTVPEVADQLGLVKGYVYELVRNGQIVAIRSGKYVRIRPAAIEQFLARCSTGLDTPLSKIHSPKHDRRGDKAVPRIAGPEADRAGRKIGCSSVNGFPLGTRCRTNPTRLSGVVKGLDQRGATAAPEEGVTDGQDLETPGQRS